MIKSYLMDYYSIMDTWNWSSLITYLYGEVMVSFRQHCFILVLLNFYIIGFTELYTITFSTLVTIHITIHPLLLNPLHVSIPHLLFYTPFLIYYYSYGTYNNNSNNNNKLKWFMVPYTSYKQNSFKHVNKDLYIFNTYIP